MASRFLRRASGIRQHREQLATREASRDLGDAVARIRRRFEAVLCLDGGGVAMAMARELSGGLAGGDKLAGETSRWYGAG